MKKYICTILFFMFLLNSCVGDDMDRTIFIPDESNPTLPAYSEWGYNSFGAIYDRNYFLVSNGITPCKITYQKGMLNFYLIGKINYWSQDDMLLSFSFPFSPVNNYADLVILNNTKIDLSDPLCIVKIEINGNEEIITPINGNLTFKRSQLLKIDGVQNRVILSGVFEIRFLRNERPETISEGRFDMGINNDFYSFPE